MFGVNAVLVVFRWVSFGVLDTLVWVDDNGLRCFCCIWLCFGDALSFW